MASDKVDGALVTEYPEPTMNQIKDVVTRVLALCSDKHNELWFFGRWAQQQDSPDPGSRLAFFVKSAARCVKAPEGMTPAVLSVADGYRAILPILEYVLSDKPPF